jgi:alanyl-tRNA synthetase
MLGNFSFGDYFKDEAVTAAWEFVTTRMELEPERLWASVHERDPVLGLAEDTVAIEAWERVGVPPDRIVRLGKDNFWQAAETGPCGACSEIFYDRGPEHGCGRADCRPGCECDRYMEIYNLVFMEYDLQPGNVLERLPNQNVDTGMGVERTAMVLQDVDSNFDTDGFRVIMDWVERESGVGYRDNEVATRAHRVIADHGRAVSFLIAEGVVPSNEGRGYICRRLLPRAIQHANRIGLDRIYRLPAVVIEQMGEAYAPARAGRRDRACRAAGRGALLGDARARPEGVRRVGRTSPRSRLTAFTLVATYGFPIE